MSTNTGFISREQMERENAFTRMVMANREARKMRELEQELKAIKATEEKELFISENTEEDQAIIEMLEAMDAEEAKLRAKKEAYNEMEEAWLDTMIERIVESVDVELAEDSFDFETNVADENVEIKTLVFAKIEKNQYGYKKRIILGELVIDPEWTREQRRAHTRDFSGVQELAKIGHAVRNKTRVDTRFGSCYVIYRTRKAVKRTTELELANNYELSYNKSLKFYLTGAQAKKEHMKRQLEISNQFADQKKRKIAYVNFNGTSYLCKTKPVFNQENVFTQLKYAPIENDQLLSFGKEVATITGFVQEFKRNSQGDYSRDGEIVALINGEWKIDFDINEQVKEGGTDQIANNSRPEHIDPNMLSPVDETWNMIVNGWLK